jgi:hypothetical protein
MAKVRSRMGILDDILKAAPAEDHAILDKYPQLKTSVEKLETDLGTYSRFAGEWLNWKDQNWDAAAGMTKVEKALRGELDAANAKLASITNAEKALREELVATNAKLGESDAPFTAEGTLRSQRAVVIWLAVAAIVLATVFPPWSQGVRAGFQIPVGYAPIWSPPYPADIDLVRLLIEWFLVGSVAGGLLLTLEKVVALVSARRKVLLRLANVAVCGLLVALGPQLAETYRRYVSDYKTDERSSVSTAYAQGIGVRHSDAKIDPSLVLDYLGNEQYRVSSYVDSPDFVGRLYFTVTMVREAPSSAQGGSKWRIETSEVTNAPGGPAVPEPQTPQLNARGSAWTAYLDGMAARYRDAKIDTQDSSSVLDYLGGAQYRASSFVESSEFEGRLFFTVILVRVRVDASSAQSASKWQMAIGTLEVIKSKYNLTVTPEDKARLRIAVQPPRR